MVHQCQLVLPTLAPEGLFGAAMFPTTWCLFVSFGAAISKFKFPLVLHSNRENHLFEGLSSNLKFKLNEYNGKNQPANMKTNVEFRPLIGFLYLAMHVPSNNKGTCS